MFDTETTVEVAKTSEAINNILAKIIPSEATVSLPRNLISSLLVDTLTRHVNRRKLLEFVAALLNEDSECTGEYVSVVTKRSGCLSLQFSPSEPEDKGV